MKHGEIIKRLKRVVIQITSLYFTTNRNHITRPEVLIMTKFFLTQTKILKSQSHLLTQQW